MWASTRARVAYWAWLGKGYWWFNDELPLYHYSNYMEQKTAGGVEADADGGCSSSIWTSIGRRSHDN